MMINLEELKKRLSSHVDCWTPDSHVPIDDVEDAVSAIEQLQADKARLERELSHAEMAANVEAKFADEMKAERDAARSELEEARMKIAQYENPHINAAKQGQSQSQAHQRQDIGSAAESDARKYQR